MMTFKRAAPNKVGVWYERRVGEINIEEIYVVAFIDGIAYESVDIDGTIPIERSELTEWAGPVNDAD